MDSSHPYAVPPTDTAPCTPPPDAWSRLPWLAPPALLMAIWLWLTFSSGGYLERQWLLPGMALSLFSLVVYALVAYPRRPRQLSLAVILLFAGYAVWVVLSATWAASVDRVWEEAGRTFVYLLLVTLALTFLTQAGARRALRYLFLAGGLTLVGVSVWALATSPDAPGAFMGNRFTYPTTYANGSAALFLVLFWPLLSIASDPLERTPWRGLSLATCWGLVALAVLTQSRGSAWALAATLVVAILVSPARLRTLTFFLVPAVLMVWAFPTLNAYWRLGPAGVERWSGPWVILIGMGVAFLTGVALALLENWVRVSTRMRLVFGSVLVAGALAGAIFGWVQLDERVGDPVAWMGESLDRFTQEKATAIPGLGPENPDDPSAVTRFTVVSSGGRWLIWQVAWAAYREEPWLGIGAGNFTLAHDRLRDRPTIKPRQPHSIELRLLSETGIVGASLFGSAIVLALGGMLWPRFSAAWSHLRRRRHPGEERRWGSDPRRWEWNTALFLGVMYWLIHGSVEWLWHMPAVTVPALLMLALGVATTDAACVLWPRWQQALARSHELTPFLMPPMVVMMRRRMRIGPGANDAGRPTEEIPERPELRDPSGEKSLSFRRRSDRYEARRRRRSRRESRRSRRARVLNPPGALSRWFRLVAAAVSLFVLLGLAAPFLSARLEESALRDVLADPGRAMQYAAAAAWLQPADAGPMLTRAAAYAKLAATDALTDGEGSPQHRWDLAMALEAHVRAIERDPAWWAVHYQAGVATVRLLDATAGTTGATAVDTIESDSEAADEAEALLALSPDDLELLARSYFVAAEDRNPLNPDVQRALESLEDSADARRNRGS